MAPHYARLGIFLTPIIVSTSQVQKGGVVRYAKVRPQIERLCKQDVQAIVSTMFDLYALPGDFPGKDAQDYPFQGSGEQKAIFLEERLAQSIDQSNFVANLMVHEFEALLFVRTECFAPWADRKTVDTLAMARQQSLPEDINDNPHTAPSKRIKQAMPTYQKTLHGPLIANDIGLDAMREACPHFAGWLSRLEALM